MVPGHVRQSRHIQGGCHTNRATAVGARCTCRAGMHHPSFDTSPIPYSLSTKQSNKRSLEAAVEAAAAFLESKQKPVALAGPQLRM